jgi:hypothetical protein
VTGTEGRTALAAAVLALLGGAVYLLGLVLDVVSLLRFPEDAGRVIIHAAVDLVLASALLPGGILLLRRQDAGRIGCVAGAAEGDARRREGRRRQRREQRGRAPGDLAMGGLTALAVVAPPALATLVLAVSAPAARWCTPEIRPT